MLRSSGSYGSGKWYAAGRAARERELLQLIFYTHDVEYLARHFLVRATFIKKQQTLASRHRACETMQGPGDLVMMMNAIMIEKLLEKDTDDVAATTQTFYVELCFDTGSVQAQAWEINLGVVFLH